MVQVALALVLLICSGLMIRTFRALTRVSPGFSDPNIIASFDIFIPTSQVPDTKRIDVLRMQQALVNQLQTVPGASSVAISTSLPMIPNPALDPVYASDRTYKEGELSLGGQERLNTHRKEHPELWSMLVLQDR